MMHPSIVLRNEYRADIDGLRALAVLSVFLFHLQPGILPGGFLGVDVFFVISGYLISGIILREHHLQRFSFLHFYARRTKRIFPALFVVLILSAIVATLLLVPETYTNFMKSARYASAQLSNFFFSVKVDYFSESFSRYALLHTWSLGVEEQFYLLWPLLIFLCFRYFNTSRTADNDSFITLSATSTATDALLSSAKTEAIEIDQSINKKIAGILLLISLVSGCACYILAELNYNLAFYMFYTRAFEFCIGGFIALKIVAQPKTTKVNQLFGILGILLLIFSFIFIKEQFLGRPFLQIGVWLPCIGSALILSTNGRRSIINRILATKLPSSIGKISYSLYLYHWPIIVFYKIYSNTIEIGGAASIGIIIAAFLLSTLSYLLVEQPARKSGLSDKRVIIIAILVIVGSALSFKFLEQFETAPWRITSYATENQDTPASLYAEGCQDTIVNDLWFLKCQKSAELDTPIIALVGDSHAPHFVLAITEWAKKNGYNVKSLGRAGCPMLLGDIHVKQNMIAEVHTQHCENALATFEKEIVDDPRVELILVAQRFDLFYNGKVLTNDFQVFFFKDSDGKIVKNHTEYYREQLAYTVDRIRQAGKEPVILKQVPLFNDTDGCNWEPLIKKLFPQERVCEYDKEFIYKWQQPSIDFLDNFASTYQVEVFDPALYFDSPLHESSIIYNDVSHLNEHGFQLLVPFFEEAMDDIIARKKANKDKTGQ